MLLVEDEPGVRMMTAQYLENQGYKVLVAANPEEAMQIWQNHSENLSLLLTDVVMPPMSGPQLAEHLAFPRPAMKVLLMSGYSEDALARYGVMGSRAGFLQNPFTRESLALKVREVLNSAFATPDAVPFWKKAPIPCSGHSTNPRLRPFDLQGRLNVAPFPKSRVQSRLKGRGACVWRQPEKN